MGLAWATLQALGERPIWDMFWADIAATIAIFVLSRLNKNSSFYDAYWSVIPPWIAQYWLDYVAAAATAIAILIKLMSDIQLHRFIDERKEGEIFRTGLWAYSRHPNYFGEWLFWAGLALFGFAAVPEAWWWVLPGALAILAMFLLASIPMIDKRSMGRRPTYAMHMLQV